MSRSFATQALSRTATFKTKQSTISTQNTFTFLKLSLPIWSLALKIQWAPLNLGDRLLLRRPWAPPADFSPSWLLDVEDRQGHLHAGKWWWRGRIEDVEKDVPRLALGWCDQPGWCTRARRGLTLPLASPHLLLQLVLPVVVHCLFHYHHFLSSFSLSTSPTVCAQLWSSLYVLL